MLNRSIHLSYLACKSCIKETKAKLIDKQELNESEDSEDAGLGNKRMESLEGMGIAYRGKIVSRKNIHDGIEDDDNVSLSSEMDDVNFPKDDAKQ